MKDLLVVIGIIALLLEGYRLLRGKWIRGILGKGKEAKRGRKPVVLKPKSERDCPHCAKEKGHKPLVNAKGPVISWSERKGKGGRKKVVVTEGYFCPNRGCEYYGIRRESVHALVGYGRHGKYEEIRDLKCQACGKKFTERRNTILYRLKTQSAEVVKILWLSVLGVDASALEEVFGVGEITIRSWICRSVENGRKLHDEIMLELELVHVQLDELWGSLKSRGQDMWVWVASDVTTKMIPVMQIGGRTQDMAYGVVHELKSQLKATCVPVFSTDGLRHYFFALTAHFGKWAQVTGKEAVWELLSDFVYGQVIKHQRRKRTVEVERRMAWGEEKEYRERLKKAGQSGRINTAFIERVNLTIRQCVSQLTRRTWGPARYSSELLAHLEWWRIYYHLARYHESLAIKLGKPLEQKGKQQAQRYRRRTPAMAAGLVTRRWTVKELLSYPLP